MEGLSDAIRTARRRLGMTQQQLASAVGVSRSAVAQWETGRSGQLTANLAKLGSVLETDLATLIAGAGGSPLHRYGDSKAGPAGADVHLGDELALLRLYRSCAPDDQRLILMAAKRLSQERDRS